MAQLFDADFVETKDNVLFLRNGLKYLLSFQTLETPDMDLQTIRDKETGEPKDIEIYPFEFVFDSVIEANKAKVAQLKKERPDDFKSINLMKKGSIYRLNAAARLFNAIITFAKANKGKLTTDSLITLQKFGLKYNTRYELALIKTK